MSHKRVVTAVLVALAAGLLGGVAAPPAQAWSGTLQYSCSGSGFGVPGTSYPFAAVMDTDVPATLPYGSQRTTAWATHLFVPESFRSWAATQGYTTVHASAWVDSAVDGVARPQMYQAAPGVAVPATPQTWTWDAISSTTVSASSLGQEALTVTGLTISAAFQKDGVNALLASATCLLDAATPTADTVVDGFDVVAATTTTTLAVSGEAATATVSSNGTPPVGIVTFSVAGWSVAMNVVAGKATAKLPALPPGDYGVSAQFVPSQPTQLTSSTAAAAYTVKPIATKTQALAAYRPARDLLKAHARVTAPDGSDVSGRVTFVLKRNGTTLDNLTVRLSAEGVAVKKFHGITKAGRYVVVAKYLGTATYERSKDRARLTLP